MRLWFIHVLYQIMEQFERIFRVHHIEHFLPASLVDHEVAGLEGLEMLGYRRLGKLDDTRQLVHRLAPLEQRLDDPIPRGVSDALAELVYFFAEIRHI